ncbi:MAG: MFS transporter [Burkholderiales bacterium]
MINFSQVLWLLTQTGSRAARVLLVLYALDLGAGPVAIGALAASLAVLPMLVSWPVGRLSDLYGARWLMMAGMLAGAAGMFIAWAWPVLPALFIAGMLNGLLVGFFNVSLQNLIGQLSTAETRPRTFSNLSLMNSGASFIGPLLAGFAIDHAGYGATALYLALLSVFPALLLLVWGGGMPKGVKGSARPAGGGLRAMLADRRVWRILFVCSMVQSGLDMFQFYMPVYAHSIGLSASVIGVLVSTFAAAGFAVRLFLPRLVRRHGEGSVLAWAFYLSAASFLLVPFFENAAVIGVLSFLFGLGNGAGQPITMMLTFSQSTDGRSGETLGLRSTVIHFTRLVAPSVFGYIAVLATLSVVFWANAAMLAAGGALSRGRRTSKQ